ncbi:smyd5 [Symbiodinium sp. CCMP2592]|nr:smyd5 [Symbiodinium sp. CCMP2592]
MDNDTGGEMDDITMEQYNEVYRRWRAMELSDEEVSRQYGAGVLDLIQNQYAVSNMEEDTLTLLGHAEPEGKPDGHGSDDAAGADPASDFEAPRKLHAMAAAAAQRAGAWGEAGARAAKAAAIAHLNAFCTLEDGLAIYERCSRFNHSCAPNAEYGLTQVRLLTAIEPGEEVCISYLGDALMSKSARQQFLRARYFFLCTCQLCSLPHDELAGWTCACGRRRLSREVCACGGTSDDWPSAEHLKAVDDLERRVAVLAATCGEKLQGLEEVKETCRKLQLQFHVVSARTTFCLLERRLSAMGARPPNAERLEEEQFESLFELPCGPRKSVLIPLVGIVGAGGFLAEGPGSLTETPASGEPRGARSFGRTPGLWLPGDGQGWPLYHAAASALTAAAVTLSFRRYRRQVRKDKKVPRAAVDTADAQSHEMGPAATGTSSRVVPTVDETGCGRHYLDFDSDSEEEEEEDELQACRRFGKIRSLPAFQRSFPDRAAGWTPEPLESSAGDLRRCSKFDPLSEMSVVSEAAAPSLLELGCLFSTLRNEAEEVDVHFIQAATDELNVGLNPADAQRIYNMLSKHGKEEISRENFMQTLRDLLSAVVGSKKHLSFRQLRVVMATAFERFDVDGDGHICVDEFACALRSYDIRLGPSETMALFRLLSPDEKDALAREDLTEPASFTDRCQVALEGAQEKAVEATGFSSAAKVLGTEEAIGPDCWIQRIQGAISGRDGPEILAGALDLATTSAAACLVLMHAHAHPHETGNVCLACQWLEQLRYAADSISSSVQDVVDSGGLLPLLISSFLGALKSLGADDLVALDQNEALLYARNFHHKALVLWRLPVGRSLSR